MSDDFEAGYRAWLNSPEGQSEVDKLTDRIVRSDQFAAATAGACLAAVGVAVDLAKRKDAVNEVLGRVVAAVEQTVRWVVEHEREILGFLMALDSWPEEHRKLFREYGKIAISVGRPPTTQLPLDAIERIVAASRRGASPEELDAMLANSWRESFTDESVDDVVARWWEWPEVMGSRRIHLEQALIAHKQGQFALSVPIILVQIEGVLANSFAHQGSLRGHGIKRKTPGTGYLEVLTAREPEEILDHACVLEYMSNLLFGQFQHGTTVRGLNRHAVLHGGDLSYATRERSLEAIMALDLVVCSLGWLATLDGVVHRPGCVHLRTHTVGVRVFRERKDAQKAGFVSCGVCASEDRA